MRTQVYTIILFLCGYNVDAQSLYVPTVDNSSYTGKAMFGYQGWFGHPDDASPRPNYWHWGILDVLGVGPLQVEMYPDLREFCEDETYPTAYSFANGNTAPVFSSGNKQTVLRHMKWVRDYDIDGVFLQRFISEYGDPVVMAFRDSVTTSVMAGCETYGRVFSIMYDGVGDAVEDIKADWMHLVDDLGIVDSDRYLHHENRPLVSLWGFTFYNNATVGQLNELIEWFHNGAAPQYRASIKLGLNDNWFSLDAAWLAAFSNVEVISPWSVGRYVDQGSYNHYVQNQIQLGKAWCDANSILFVPVLFPGFSWYNLKDASTQQNQIPRDGGHFFWMQAHGAIQENCESLYFAMLDELDEATAFFKTAEQASQSPSQGYWLNLDADGYDLPSDWYLRCASKATKTLRNQLPNSSTLGTPPEGIMTIRIDESTCLLQFIFPDYIDATQIEISVDGGQTYPYTTIDQVGIFEVAGSPSERYDIMIRYPNEAAVPMGELCLPADCMLKTAVHVNLDDDCIQLFPNPSNSQLYIQVGHQAYQITVFDSQGTIVQSYLTDEDLMIDVSTFPSGLHVIEFVNQNNAQVYLRKLLKQ